MCCTVELSNGRAQKTELNEIEYGGGGHWTQYLERAINLELQDSSLFGLSRVHTGSFGIYPTRFAEKKQKARKIFTKNPGT